jgi:YidC/Oxa1 family membrane protein insertase
MDKNTITGLVLIFVILITFSYLNKPSQSDLEAARRQNDSIVPVEAQKARQAEAEAKMSAASLQAKISNPSADSAGTAGVENELKNLYGVFSDAVKGTGHFITLENNLMKIRISTKGGKIYSVELKGYKRFNGEPLVLFEGDKNRFGLNFFSQNKSIQTDQLFFVPSVTDTVLTVSGAAISKGKEGREKFNEGKNGGSKSLAMRLDAGNGVAVEYVYTLKHNSFMVGFDIKTSGLKKVMGANSDYINFAWSQEMPRQEKVSKFGEDNYATTYFKYYQDEVDKIATKKSETKPLTTKVEWVSFKTLFFSSALIADKAFLNGKVSTKAREKDPLFVSDMSADLIIPLDASGSETFKSRFYFGPNQYNTLNQYDIKLEEELSLGWTVIGWANKIFIIPAFDFLRRYIGNFGLIILLLTIYVKLIIAPFTYKSYISQAKMRLLKPEIDEIQKKFGPDKKMESQQATMALYKKAGVNPLGGCLPMLFQMPFLIAMFYFFPISIELRQQSFLWAHDLSSYDSIFTLPFEVPFGYGSHVSLFCLLMTVTNILYVKYNNEMSGAGTQQMPGMKTMMYLMPVMFLFIFNSYASGLSLYYFLSLVFTFVQMWIFKRLIDEDAIHAQLKAKQKMPVVKSKFTQRLEEMAKQRNMPQKKK